MSAFTDTLRAGDSAWWARFAPHSEERVTCPVCYGTLAVHVTLGNGDVVKTPCDYCGKGYEGPRGWVTDYKTVAEPRLVTIDYVIETQTEEGVKREFRNDSYVLDECDLFESRAEAEQRANEKGAEYIADMERRAEWLKENSKKSFSWHVGYHMREAKRCREKAEYHDRKAELCKARAKDGEA